MPGFLLTAASMVLCAHGGQAQPMTPNPRIRVVGAQAVTLVSPYTVAGCALLPPPAGAGPCVTAQWVSGSVRVTAAGAPVLLQGGQSVCVPTGTPLMVAVTQSRVQAI